MIASTIRELSRDHAAGAAGDRRVAAGLAWHREGCRPSVGPGQGRSAAAAARPRPGPSPDVPRHGAVPRRAIAPRRRPPGVLLLVTDPGPPGGGGIPIRGS